MWRVRSATDLLLLLLLPLWVLFSLLYVNLFVYVFSVCVAVLLCNWQLGY